MILDVVLLTLGAAIVAAVLLDLASTTISLSAVRGPLSTRLSAAVWFVGRKAAGTPFAVFRRGAGPLVIVVVLLGWLLSLTAGWTLVFSTDGALTSAAAEDQRSASVRWVDALFFVFGSLIGRGSSSLQAEAVAWSSAVAAMSLTGVALITLALAWILPVVGAVVGKRSLAGQLSALGGTPQQIVLRGWNGRDLGDLNLHLLPLVSELTLLAERHLAYPVIHYFTGGAARTAIGPRLAALDEALTVIRAAGLDDPARETGLGPSVTDPLRQAIDGYLATLDKVFIHPAADTPPAPELDQLVAAGILDEHATGEALQGLLDETSDRRALLLGYVRHDGWRWDDVTQLPL